MRKILPVLLVILMFLGTSTVFATISPHEEEEPAATSSSVESETSSTESSQSESSQSTSSTLVESEEVEESPQESSSQSSTEGETSAESETLTEGETSLESEVSEENSQATEESLQESVESEVSELTESQSTSSFSNGVFWGMIAIIVGLVGLICLVIVSFVSKNSQKKNEDVNEDKIDVGIQASEEIQENKNVVFEEKFIPVVPVEKVQEDVKVKPIPKIVFPATEKSDLETKTIFEDEVFKEEKKMELDFDLNKSVTVEKIAKEEKFNTQDLLDEFLNK